MIIDLILDREDFEAKNPDVTYADYEQWAKTPVGKNTIETARKNGRIIAKPYNPKEFYLAVMEYGGYSSNIITYAMDYSDEMAVREALCEYIVGNEYNPEICDYINSVNWLTA